MAKTAAVKTPPFGGPKDPVSGKRTFYMTSEELANSRTKMGVEQYRRLAGKAADSAIYRALACHELNDENNFERLHAALGGHWKKYYPKKLQIICRIREGEKAGVSKKEPNGKICRLI